MVVDNLIIQYTDEYWYIFPGLPCNNSNSPKHPIVDLPY